MKKFIAFFDRKPKKIDSDLYIEPAVLADKNSIKSPSTQEKEALKELEKHIKEVETNHSYKS